VAAALLRDIVNPDEWPSVLDELFDQARQIAEVGQEYYGAIDAIYDAADEAGEHP